MRGIALFRLIISFEVVAALGMIASAGTVEGDPRWDKKVEAIVAKKFWGPVELSPKERNELIEYGRTSLAAAKSSGDIGLWRQRLVILGDEETIRSVLKTEDDVRYWSRDFIASGSPAAIEVLAPWLFKAEQLVNRMASDIEILSVSHFLASRTLPSIIVRCQEFDPSVKEWAKLIRDVDKPGDNDGRYEWCRDVMRTWWKENEKFFREKDYKSVRAGSRPPWLETVPHVEGKSSGAEQRGKTAGMAETTNTAAPANESFPNAVESSKPPPSSSTVLWIIAAIAVLLSVGILARWKRSKP